LLVASQLLDLGVATGAAFRFMRKALGLRAVDLAELLNVNAATVSRWENGKVAVDRAALATLAAAASERLDDRDSTLARLRRLREGKRPARALRVNLAKAS
jgi:transcriptional regulator with XRE-family HTH domain